MSGLPQNWAAVTLGELTQRTRPICYGVLKPGPFEPTGIPLIRIKDLGGGTVAQSDLHLITPALDDEFGRSRLTGGEVLLSIQGTVGRVAICPDRLAGANISRTIAVIKPDGRMLPRFLMRYLEYLAVSDGFETGGTTRRSLNISTIRAMTVPVPPLDEQRRIIAVVDTHLSHLDAGVESLRSASTRLAALRLAVLKGFFGDVDGLTGTPIAELLEVNIGGVWGEAPGASEVDVPVARVTEFRPGGVVAVEAGAIRSITLRQLASRRLRSGDLLLEKSGGGPRQPVGRVSRVGDRVADAVCGNFIQLMRPDSTRVDSEFLFWAMTWLYDSGIVAEFQTASTNIRNIKTKEYLLRRIPVPSLDRQHAVVAQIEMAWDHTERAQKATALGSTRGTRLRSAVLAAAFSGRLHEDWNEVAT